MGCSIVRTPRARQDLIEIWNYIADDNESVADRLLDRIERVLQTIGDNPQAGRARPELGPEVRSFPVGNYIIFYRLVPAAVEVIRVRSGFMDIQPEDMD